METPQSRPQPDPKPWHRRPASGPSLAGIGIALSVTACVVVLYAADQEPFFRFEWLDAILFFGVAPLLMAALLVWSPRCLAALTRAAPRFGRLYALPLLLWVLLLLVQLGFTVYGYYGDLTRPALPQLGSLGGSARTAPTTTLTRSPMNSSREISTPLVLKRR